MKILKIKDNSLKTKNEFSEITHLTDKIADKTLEKLEREGIFVFPEIISQTEDLTKDQMILQGNNEFYLSSNVMGFLGYGDERLIIESRFSNGENDYFFQYLLEKVLDFPNIVDLKTDADQNNRLFNYLLFLFPQYLKAAMRKGLYKQYVRHYHNDSNIKGVINIKQHITNNTPFIGKIAYSQREFCYDNYLTQLIRHTIEFIKKNLTGIAFLVNQRMK